MSKLEWWAGQVGTNQYTLGWGRTLDAALSHACGMVDLGETFQVVQARVDATRGLGADDLQPFSEMSDPVVYVRTEDGACLVGGNA